MGEGGSWGLGAGRLHQTSPPGKGAMLVTVSTQGWVQGEGLENPARGGQVGTWPWPDLHLPGEASPLPWLGRARSSPPSLWVTTVSFSACAMAEQRFLRQPQWHTPGVRGGGDGEKNLNLLARPLGLSSLMPIGSAQVHVTQITGALANSIR